jgi:hypothetical protein
MAIARDFFATIQNKLVFAVTGRTAAELIVARADPRAPNMGLTSWTGARVRKGDVTVSKNYLTAGEIDELNRLTTMFLDFAEDRARRRQQTRMADWAAHTDRFLDFHERSVLNHAGEVSRDEMTKLAHERFDGFDTERRALEAAEADREAAEELAAIEAEADRLRRTATATARPDGCSCAMLLQDLRDDKVRSCRLASHGRVTP